jgi:hypothetical protein
MISPPEESADTNSLLPLSPTEDRTGGNGVLRQGSKKLWRKLSSRETASGMSNVESHADVEAELDEDRNAGNYNLLNNLNNQRQPRYISFDHIFFFFIFLVDDFGGHYVDPSSVAVITIDLYVTAASSTMESISHSIANRSCLIRTRSQVQRRSVRKIPSAVTAHRLELHRQDSIT